MEHRDDAPLADEAQAGAIPNDQPLTGVGEPADADPPDDGDDDEADEGPRPGA